MERLFNIAGPCVPEEHYMLPPERRMGEALELIRLRRWFAVVSGRQTGKTTVVQRLAKNLTARGEHLALWIDLENARDRPDPAVAMPIVFDALRDGLARSPSPHLMPGAATLAGWLTIPDTALVHALRALCAASERPVVLLFDEADVLTGAAMVSFLTQLRALYLARHEQPAPSSVALVGTRSVRDYVLDPEGQRALPRLGTASPFNVTVESVTLGPFAREEVGELLGQHTAATGQRFEDDAVERVWWLSQGHPWLVNALADQVVRRDVKDRSVAVTAEHIERAKETIILERRTHLDSLLARLREERVRRILAPMIAGETAAGDTIDDDLAYVAGLGLIRQERGRWVVANPIYREVVPRTLTFSRQTQLPHETAWYVRPDGSLDVPKLMAAWQEFWREDGHLAAAGFDYLEAGPHLMLMAFLQRIVNGGGRIEREYALGKDALDLLVVWKTQRVAIEIKLWRRPTTEAKGLAQLGGYLDALGLDEGWLMIFRNDPKLTWDERVFTRTEIVGARRVHVVGC